jgi:hypothetical protein
MPTATASHDLRDANRSVDTSSANLHPRITDSRETDAGRRIMAQSLANTAFQTPHLVPSLLELAAGLVSVDERGTAGLGPNVGDDGANRTLGPSVGDDGRPGALGPNIGDDVAPIVTLGPSIGDDAQTSPTTLGPSVGDDLTTFAERRATLGPSVGDDSDLDRKALLR